MSKATKVKTLPFWTGDAARIRRGIQLARDPHGWVLIRYHLATGDNLTVTAFVRERTNRLLRQVTS